MADPFFSVSTQYRYEPEKIKGSRFIATVAPVRDESEADAFLVRIRAEFADARHVCWAWRLGEEGEAIRSSDDGEPGGSAGRPILAQLEGHGVIGAALAVTRYFGGVKLGVGGLIRAYGGAAGKCLDRAGLEPVVILRRFEVRHDYDCSSAVQAALHHLGLKPLEPQFGERVQFMVEVPRDDADSFLAELTERTAGRAEIDLVN